MLIQYYGIINMVLRKRMQGFVNNIYGRNHRNGYMYVYFENEDF